MITETLGLASVDAGMTDLITRQKHLTVCNGTIVCGALALCTDPGAVQSCESGVSEPSRSRVTLEGGHKKVGS